MEIKLIIFIISTFVIQTTVSQINAENHSNNDTNLSKIELNSFAINENETIRTKRHPALLLKTRPIRLKRLPITTVYRRHPPPGHPPPSKYGPPSQPPNLTPPKIRYGLNKHKPGHSIDIDYSPPSDFLESYHNPHSSISETSSHHDLLNGYQETDLVDTNLFDSYESYKTPIHFSSNSQSSNYEYYPSHEPSIPLSNTYNSDSSSSSSYGSGSSSGSKLKFPYHHPENYHENLNSDSYSGSYYSIPSTSYGVPSNTYSDAHVQQPQEHQYSSYVSQHQAPSQGSYNYQPAPVQHNPAPPQHTQSAVSYSPPADTYNYQPPQQTPISYKSPPNYQQNNQQGTYNFAEPPQPNKHHQQPPQQVAPSNPVYSNSVTSYNPPANYPVQHQPSTKLQGAYNTPIPKYTNKKRPSNRATTKQTPNDNIISVQTEKYDFQLDESDNSGSLYDTSISSYDVPLHYNYAKDHKSQKSYPPNENFEPTKPKKVASPPMLPNIYDQGEFNSFKKSRNEPSKTRQPELQDFSQFFDAAVFQPHSTQKPKKRTKNSSSRPPITNLNAFASYAESHPTTEHYYNSEPTTTVHSTSTAVNSRFRRRKPTTRPPYLSSSSSAEMAHHNLDTDDLRDAYGSPTRVRSTVIRSDAIAKFESMKSKNRLPPAKPSETKNKSTNNTIKYHSSYSTKPKEPEKYDVVSIEKSHSYYAGTMAPSLAVNVASKRHYDVAGDKKDKTKYDDDEDDTESDSKAFNVFSSGFYVSDGSVADINDGDESDFNSDYYDNEDDFDATYNKRSGENTRKPIWSGGSLPKNHKFTSKDLTVHT